jgi:hypothetical protein|tara:strand:+ start:255 stop:470 length:216 start_codon:yes stop_codon:yes gene_type:complete
MKNQNKARQSRVMVVETQKHERGNIEAGSILNYSERYDRYVLKNEDGIVICSVSSNYNDEIPHIFKLIDDE